MRVGVLHRFEPGGQSAEQSAEQRRNARGQLARVHGRRAAQARRDQRVPHVYRDETKRCARHQVGAFVTGDAGDVAGCEPLAVTGAWSGQLGLSVEQHDKQEATFSARARGDDLRR